MTIQLKEVAMTNQVDHAEIKMGQILTVAISGAALLLQDPIPLGVLGVIFLLSGTLRSLSPFSILYRWVINPAGIMQSDYRLDNIQPHKFGQLVGALTVLLALGLMQFGYLLAGWSVVALLLMLTVISYAGWCIGCFMYYQLSRLGIGGFFRYSTKNKSVSLGMRPGKDHT
jgi:Domain of unknown function (DUF4395)